MSSLSEKDRLRLIQLDLELDEEPEMTAGGAFGLSAGETVANNALGVPQLIGRLPSFIAAGAQGLVGSRGDPGVLLGGDFDFSRRLEQQDRPFLAEAAFNTPRPEVSDVAGASRALMQNPETGAAFGDRFQEEKMGFEDEMAAMREQFPKASFAGDVFGDVTTLFGGRASVNAGKRMRDLEQAVKKKFGHADIEFGGAALTSSSKGVKKVFESIQKSDAVNALARGAGRTLETGLEAAALDVLHGDDPLETAAYAMAGQATGSAFLTGMKATFAGNLSTAALNIGAASFAAGSLWQIVKDMTPGGRDSIIDSIEAGYEKVMFAMLLGALAGATGGGRIRGDLGKSGLLAKEVPRFADAISAVPRGITLSLLEDLVNSQPEQQRNVETALQRLSIAGQGTLNKLSDATMEKINKSLEQGTFGETIETLMNTDEGFRDWMSEEEQ